jgi:hypothetical protein
LAGAAHGFGRGKALLYTDLLEAMHIAEEDYPEIAEGLKRIREEELHHREEVLDMLSKSDPYTLPQDHTEKTQTDKQA